MLNSLREEARVLQNKLDDVDLRDGDEDHHDEDCIDSTEDMVRTDGLMSPGLINPELRKQIQKCEEILQKVPEEPKTLSEQRILEGEVQLQRSGESRWQTKIIIYKNGQIEKHVKDAIGAKSCPVCFITQDPLFAEHQQAKLDRQGLLQQSHYRIEGQPEFFYLILYTPDAVLNLRFGTLELATSWFELIIKDLEELFPLDLWKQKVQSAQQLRQLARVQFDFELRRYNGIIQRIANSGLMERVGFKEQKKKMSGSMQLLVDKQWKDYHFALLGTTLLYSVDVKMTVSTGIIALKYASVTVYESLVRENKFVWTIETPLRNYHLRCKHAPSLSEWLHAVELSILKTPKHQSSTAILTEIQAMQTDLSSMESIIQQPVGYKTFREFIPKDEYKVHLRFCRDVQRYWKHELALFGSREEHTGDPAKELANFLVELRVRYHLLNPKHEKATVIRDYRLWKRRLKTDSLRKDVKESPLHLSPLPSHEEGRTSPSGSNADQTTASSLPSSEQYDSDTPLAESPMGHDDPLKDSSQHSPHKESPGSEKLLTGLVETMSASTTAVGRSSDSPLSSDGLHTSPDQSSVSSLPLSPDQASVSSQELHVQTQPMPVFALPPVSPELSTATPFLPSASASASASSSSTSSSSSSTSATSASTSASTSSTCTSSTSGVSSASVDSSSSSSGSSSTLSPLSPLSPTATTIDEEEEEECTVWSPYEDDPPPKKQKIPKQISSPTTLSVKLPPSPVPIIPVSTESERRSSTHKRDTMARLLKQRDEDLGISEAERKKKKAEREKRSEREGLIYHDMDESEYDYREVLAEMQRCCYDLLHVHYYTKFMQSEAIEKIHKAHRKLKQAASLQQQKSSGDIERFDITKFKLVIKEKISSRKVQKQKNSKVRFRLKAVPFPTDKPSVTIGRDLTNYISIGDSGISRAHGRIEWDDTQCTYFDTGSSFGSKLNGEVVTRAPLKVGDHIQLGRSVITLRDRDWVGDEEGRDDCVGTSRLTNSIDTFPFEESGKSCLVM